MTENSTEADRITDVKPTHASETIKSALALASGDRNAAVPVGRGPSRLADDGDHRHNKFLSASLACWHHDSINFIHVSSPTAIREYTDSRSLVDILTHSEMGRFIDGGTRQNPHASDIGRIFIIFDLCFIQ